MTKFIALVLSVSTLAFSTAEAYSTYKKSNTTRNRTRIAQNSVDTSMTYSSIQQREMPRHRLYLDSAYLLTKGAGVGYEYSVADNITIGPFINFFTLASDDDKSNFSTFDFTNEMRQYGLKGRVFFSGTSSEKGAYLMGGVTQVHAETKAEYPGQASATEVADTTGYLVGAGFQFDMMASNSSKFMINLAGVYGTGYAVKNAAIGGSFFQTQVTELKIEDSLFFELTLGMLF